MNRTIAVVGLGFIGLPLSLCYCEKGYKVVAVDINAAKIDELQSGHTDVHEENQGEPLESLLRRHLESGAFVPTTGIAQAAEEASAFIVTVGLPVSSDGQVIDAHLVSAMESIGTVLRPGHLVLIRTTVIPGMVEDKLIPILAQTSGLIPGKDFHVAYAAERVAEGRAMLEFQTLDIVLAGYSEKCAEVARRLLADLTSGQIHITNLRTAQLSKVIENAQRDVNIALAQQLSILAKAHGVDVYELIKMANTHPRVRLLEPGIGVGGFCIPNAFHYLDASVPEGVRLELFELARFINEDTPRRMVEELRFKLLQVGKALCDSKIAVLGLGMKDNSNDIRLSPAVRVVEILLAEGARVSAFDPTVPAQLPYQSQTLKECLMGADGLVVGAWQPAFEHCDLASAIQGADLQGAVIDLKHRLQSILPSRIAYASTH